MGLALGRHRLPVQRAASSQIPCRTSLPPRRARSSTTRQPQLPTLAECPGLVCRRAAAVPASWLKRLKLSVVVLEIRGAYSTGAASCPCPPPSVARPASCDGRHDRQTAIYAGTKCRFDGRLMEGGREGRDGKGARERGDPKRPQLRLLRRSGMSSCPIMPPRSHLRCQVYVFVGPVPLFVFATAPPKGKPKTV